MHFRLLLCEENMPFVHFDFIIAKGIDKRTVNVKLCWTCAFQTLW